MPNPTFNLKINGLDQLIARAEEAGGLLPELLKKAMVDSVNLIAKDAQAVKAGRFKNQTGNLRRQILFRVESMSRGVVFVSSLAPYGYNVEFGSAPHLIQAVNKKVLADQKMNVIFGKVVRHPGSKPYPFMAPAFTDNQGKVVDIYKAAAQTMLELMAH